MWPLTMTKRLNTDEILAALLARLPEGARAAAEVCDTDVGTTLVSLEWPGGPVHIFLHDEDLRVPLADFDERWIAPALNGSAPTGEPLVCLSCGAPKLPGVDLPCGH